MVETDDLCLFKMVIQPIDHVRCIIKCYNFDARQLFRYTTIHLQNTIWIIFKNYNLMFFRHAS